MYISIWIIIIVIVGIFLYYISENKKETFKPFRVEIYPNWYQILADYKPNEIEMIHKDVLSRIFKQDYTDQNTDFWKVNIYFTILKNDKNSKLVFDDIFSHFHSKINFSLPKYSYFPELSVTEGVDGYDLSIKTDKLLKITTIPYGISDDVQENKDIKKIIDNNEWKIKELDHDSFFKDYNCLEHKYFTVYYKGI